MSLNRKNCRGFGFFLHIFVRTPSPTSTLPDTARGYKHITTYFNTKFIESIRGMTKTAVTTKVCDGCQ